MVFFNLLPRVSRLLTGSRQIKEFNITSAANAGLVTVATITGQPCLIKSVVLHSNGSTTSDLTSAAIQGGASQVVEFLSAVDSAQANIDAVDKQVGWDGVVRLVANKTIVIDLQGTGATTVDFTVAIEYESCSDGGYLV